MFALFSSLPFALAAFAGIGMVPVAAPTVAGIGAAVGAGYTGWVLHRLRRIARGDLS